MCSPEPSLVREYGLGELTTQKAGVWWSDNLADRARPAKLHSCATACDMLLGVSMSTPRKTLTEGRLLRNDNHYRADSCCSGITPETGCTKADTAAVEETKSNAVVVETKSNAVVVEISQTLRE